MSEREEMTRLNADEEQILREYRGVKRTTYFRHYNEAGEYVDYKNPETIDTRLYSQELLKAKKELKRYIFDKVAELAPQTKINQALTLSLRDKAEEEEIKFKYYELMDKYDNYKAKILKCESIESIENCLRELYQS